MSDSAAYVAVDLGAESGRVMVGTLESGRVKLEQVHRFANVPVATPDGLHWNALRLYSEILEGLRAAEYTNASTTGALGVDGRWASDLLARLDLPAHMLLSPTSPGTVLGHLRPAVLQETGLFTARVILPASHDTACAVAAVPATP